ncbi:MAG: hypothetical protein PHR13_12685 [Dysgonamonadaceae bacterium]|nr:hypothetical protein [Dysgonamonadaceae bacterium]
MEFLAFSQTKLGSSLALPANGLGGSRATSFLVAHFALQNTASNPAEKNRAKPEKQKGKKEGGWGEGIFALLRLEIKRFRFPLNQRKAKHKIFHLLLKEKNAREKIKKCREKFYVLFCRSGAEASGNAPHYYSGFSLKKVRISFRVRSQIVCCGLFASALRASVSALRALKPDFERICHAPRGSKNNSRSRKIRFAQVYLRFRISETANLFFSPYGRVAKR